jgi:hypothetical protein
VLGEGREHQRDRHADVVPRSAALGHES